MILAILLLVFAFVTVFGTLAFATTLSRGQGAFVLAYNACLTVVMVLAAIALL
jgi:hypothetical protein